jgi:hypothetical protein
MSKFVNTRGNKIFKNFESATIDLSIYELKTISRTGSSIEFDRPAIYNSPTTPSSVNITDNLTNARIGVVQKIYHQDTTPPTFPATWILVGTNTYDTSTLNIIFAEWVSGTRVEYWITKI